MRILIVDDDPSIRKLLKAMLQRFQVTEILEAGDAIEAGTVLKREHVDGVLLDLVMPGMDGIELGRALRAELAPPDLPLLVVSAAGEVDRVIALRELDIQGFLLKPLNPTIVSRRIQEFVQLCRAYHARWVLAERARAAARLAEAAEGGGEAEPLESEATEGPDGTP